MDKGKAFQARLLKSIGRAPIRSTATATRSTAVRSGPASTAADGRRCSRVTVSLYPADLERLRAIRSYMADRGELITQSAAVKLAIRTAATGQALAAAFEAVRSEDGRG